MTIPVWLKPSLWGALAGAAAMAIIGFSQLGWTTSSTAERLAQERADTAVVMLTALPPARELLADRGYDSSRLRAAPDDVENLSQIWAVALALVRLALPDDQRSQKDKEPPWKRIAEEASSAM